MAAISKRPATASAHELRDIKKYALQQKNRHCKSLSMTDLMDGLSRDLFDRNGNKCSPRKKVGEGSGSSGVFEIEYDDNDELNQERKVVKLVDILNKTYRKDFKEEIKVLRKTDSPQIVKYFGTARNDLSNDVKNSEIGIILEFCENGDLYYHLNRMDTNSERLDETMMKKWCNECILAIKYLHHHKIIHRDIKSLNYLVGNDYQIKLSDFGKARKNNTFNRDRTLKRLRSSPCWTAPELCNWDEETEENLATYASDIYALTIVLWEIIYYFYHQSYRKPYTGGIYEIYNKIGNNERPKVDEQFSRECKHFLRKGWHLDQNKRPSANRMVRKFGEICF